MVRRQMLCRPGAEWRRGMNCSQCGHEAADGANACTNCGASLAAGTQAPPPGSFAAPPGAGTPAPAGSVVAPGAAGQFAFNFNRLTQIERVIGIATFILLVSLFLPWAHWGGSATLNGQVVEKVSGGSWSGYTDHGYFWLVFIICLAVLGYLVVKASLPHMPITLPVSDDQALLILTAVSFIVVLIGFIFIGNYAGGGNYSTSAGGANYSYHFGVTRSWGAYLSLVAALVATAPLSWPAIRKRMNNTTA
jgi:zinc-ribbon domain